MDTRRLHVQGTAHRLFDERVAVAELAAALLELDPGAAGAGGAARFPIAINIVALPFSADWPGRRAFH